jgi:hypothetical protein
MIFLYAEEGDQFQRDGKGAKNTSAVSRAASDRCKAALRQSSVCNGTSVQSQSERDKTVAGNENGPPSAWGEVRFLW